MVIAGDRGLAGGYNANIFRLAEKLAAGHPTQVIPVGKKACERYPDADESAATVESMLEPEAAGRLADSLLRSVRSGACGEVRLLFTRFVNGFVQRAEMMTLLPVRPGTTEGAGRERAAGLIELEPSPADAAKSIARQYLAGLLYWAAAESYASEQAARRTAMEGATKSAGEMLDELSGRYNRARQELVTREIAEITAGAAGWDE